METEIMVEKLTQTKKYNTKKMDTKKQVEKLTQTKPRMC